VLTFLIILYCQKSYQNLDLLVLIIECYRKKLSLNPTSSLKFESRTFLGFVTFVPIISPKQANLVLAAFYIPIASKYSVSHYHIHCRLLTAHAISDTVHLTHHSLTSSSAYQMLQSCDWYSFIFMTYCVQILDQRLAILTEVSLGFSQSFQESSVSTFKSCHDCFLPHPF
jgi:hypothetical protein